jgi:hypothetical protein
MSTKSLVIAVFAVLLVSSHVFAQSTQQFPHLSPGDKEYFWQHGRDTPKQVDQVEASVFASWPYLALFIAGACAAEKLRERRRENAWQRQSAVEMPIAPLVQRVEPPSEPAFQALTAADMMNFSRPRGARRIDPTLEID